MSGSAAMDGRPCRILHLEDSPIDAELVQEQLARSDLGCAIQLVVTREDYAAALLERGFDLILADYVVPGFDGMAALAMAREIAPDTPFIFVSGTLGEEEAVEAVRQGATDYILKQRLARLPVAIRRALAEARTRRGQREALAALRESEARLRVALDAGRLGAWELDLRTLVLKASATCQANFGRPPGAPFAYADLLAAIHPDDRDRVQQAMARSIAERLDYDAEYRAMGLDGVTRWVQVRGRAIHAADGTPVGMAGVSLDITERKAAEERQLLLSREVDHRAKNALAVVQAMLRLTSAMDVPSYVRSVEGRVAALVRAQTLLARDSWAGADLRTLLEGELGLFLEGQDRRVRLQGPPVSLPATVTQPMAMVAHELATNAVKYGSLSVAEGRLDLSWGVEEGGEQVSVLRLRWAEQGGPPVTGKPKRRGFGSRVLDGTVHGQLGGEVRLDWRRTGLVCEVLVPLSQAPEAVPGPQAVTPAIPQPALHAPVMQDVPSAAGE
ncbi:PAS domain-containing protein [Roseomonas sp. SSH11]|uniref:histidine kinase n=1 Tax=Pararoseomonas baculiformis TaxID=2820812 RepID=A0ABS4AII3_9PROT|nr:HWE histidine kinase domain-containing protein [Pararoseomonas baculiformis]MBP0446806.1 PAS domain-containing protein [Pararoseomonas baculiformis]